MDFFCDVLFQYHETGGGWICLVTGFLHLQSVAWSGKRGVHGVVGRAWRGWTWSGVACMPLPLGKARMH